MTELKDRIRRAREALGFSQRKLAELTGLGNRHIGLIENGDRLNITGETAIILARELHCTLDWLLLGTGEAPSGVVHDAPSATGTEGG